MAKAIQNYTTTISVEKTIAEIQKRIGEFGIRGFMTDYNDDGSVKGIGFRLSVPNVGMMSFYIEPELRGVYNCLKGNTSIVRKQRTMDQAARTAWRIEKDSIFATLAKVEAETASILTAFLPYAQTQTGETLAAVVGSGEFQKQLTGGVQ